nr:MULTISPECIES: serine/threonine-protein kinase [unclassified Leptolyngbya]
MPGKDLRRSRYRLLGLVGQGQFGRVYCAVHRRTGQLVALKDLDHERFPTHKFLRELRFLLSLEHPNIVTCHSLEHTRTGRYLVMDYCEGGTLRGLMEEDTRLSLPQSIKLTMDILSGLEQAHQRGIVHCDIKPENILLNLEPHGWKARISDFGIARLSQESEAADPHSGTGNTGSPAYMAPERFYGQYSKTSDLYSVGVLLFELLSGDRPFSGTPGELMSAHLNKPLKFPDAIAPVWYPVLLMALQKLVARRFQTAGDMLLALKQAAAADGILSSIERQPVTIPLLQSNTELTPASLSENRTDRIGEPFQAIAPLPEQNQKLFKPFPALLKLCVAKGKALSIEQRETALTENPISYLSHTVKLPDPIRQLVPTSEGCYALTERAFYQINWSYRADLPPVPLTHLEPGAIAALSPQQQWLAIAAPQPDLPTWQLRVLSLQSENVPPRLVSVPYAQAQTQVEHLVFLDDRHLVAISQRSKAETHSSWMDVLARRGKHLGRFELPIQMGQVVKTAFPYRLVVSDRRDPQSLVTIDLKPYRISRFALGIVPEIIAVAPWGYVVADAKGQVLMLDEYGQRVGRIDLPFPATAIVPFDAHGLLIATWNETWGHLHILNLKTLDIQFLF